jgi:hypothetical protein
MGFDSLSHSLSIRDLRHAGMLAGRESTTAAPVCNGLTVGPSPFPTPSGLLELTGLAPGLIIPLERRPFHQSPGRWHFLCPACGLRKGVLVRVPADGPPVAAAVRWACRNCALGREAGSPPRSPTWPLTPDQRLKRALEKAAEADRRRPQEKRRDWRKRIQRAALARQKAVARADQEAARLARGLDV